MLQTSMGTETKFNSYKENTTATTSSVFRSKVAHNGSSATAIDAGVGVNVGISGVGQKLLSSNGALNGALNSKQQHNNITNHRSNKSEAILTPVFVPIHIGEDVISGAKEILKVIRPQWNISHVQFKVNTEHI